MVRNNFTDKQEEKKRHLFKNKLDKLKVSDVCALSSLLIMLFFVVVVVVLFVFLFFTDNVRDRRAQCGPEYNKERFKSIGHSEG